MNKARLSRGKIGAAAARATVFCGPSPLWAQRLKGEPAAGVNDTLFHPV